MRGQLSEQAPSLCEVLCIIQVMSQSTAFDTTTAEARSVSGRVVSAVAEELDVDRTEIDPLYSVVDPDALDALFAPDPVGRPPAMCRVSFRYCGCEVQVSGDGDVHVSTPA